MRRSSSIRKQKEDELQQEEEDIIFELSKIERAVLLKSI